MRASKGVAAWLVVALDCAFLFGCARPPAQPMTEASAVPQKSEAPSAPSQPAEMPKLPPPNPEQVQEAVKRIFKDAVVIDASRKPSFLVGDFNGDQSQDLAIVLKPAPGKLSELNQEFPNWIAREPIEALLSSTKPLARPAAAKPLPNPASGQTVRFEQADVLLAIIHGSGPKGWHDPEATQTHLMRDVVGTDMRMLPLKEAARVYARTKPIPAIHGDLIQETLIGQAGFLHYAGSTYRWYDPKNFRPDAMPAHGSVSRMR